MIRKDGTFFAEGKAKSSEQLQQLTELAILYNTYVAFLVSYHDGNYRDAFDLLYDTELFLKDFEKLASSYSENQFSHDAV